MLQAFRDPQLTKAEKVKEAMEADQQRTAELFGEDRIESMEELDGGY